MSLSVTGAQVRAKSGWDDDSVDAAIAILIPQQLPVLERAIRPEFLEATSDYPLQSTLNLGALEIVAGELVAQLARVPGTYDQVEMDRLIIRPYIGANMADPTGLIAQGWNRLRPFLRTDPLLPASAPVGVATGKSTTEDA